MSDILPRNFGWDRHKLATLTYEELERLEADVKENNECRNGIYIYDVTGMKKLDALSWAVYYKNKAGRAADPEPPEAA